MKNLTPKYNLIPAKEKLSLTDDNSSNTPGAYNPSNLDMGKKIEAPIIEDTSPQTTSNYSLGSLLKKWANLYLSGTAFIPRRLIDAFSSDHDYVGTAISVILSGATVAAFELVYLGSGGKWLLCDSDAIATSGGMLGIAMEAKNDTEAMMVALPGSFIRDDTWTWTVGDTLYAGETPGAIQATIPTGVDGIVKVIGWAVTASIIYFNPSSDNLSITA